MCSCGDRESIIFSIDFTCKVKILLYNNRIMNEPQHISNFLDKLKDKLSDKYQKEQNINSIDWNNIAGEKLAAHSSIDALLRNKLQINCDSSSYLFEMNMQKDRILLELRRIYPNIRIDDLKLKVKPEA